MTDGRMILKTIPWEEDPNYESFGVDWKATPEEVLESVDDALKNHGLGIVLIDTGDDTVAYAVLPRECSL